MNVLQGPKYTFEHTSFQLPVLRLKHFSMNQNPSLLAQSSGVNSSYTFCEI